MRSSRALLLVAFFLPSIAAAQTSTSDGIKALVRGDSATAAAILKPLAENAASPDPTAQFFMAVLYESGSGVQSNFVRACGLYLKAAAVPSPFATQALGRARAIGSDEPLMRHLCEDANAGVWRQPPSVRFTLGPDHWLKIYDSGFTVGFQGAERTSSVISTLTGCSCRRSTSS